MPGGSPELQQEGLQEAGYRLEIRFRYREETS
jgi:hypothetical protein